MKEHPLTGHFLTKMGIRSWIVDDNEGIIKPTLTAEQRATLDNHIKNDADIEALRLKRNHRIQATDSWALSDRTMTDAQKKYRQDLRDLPANTADPANPIWPTKPT